MNKLSILVVDDSETDRYLFVRQIEETNLNISVFEKEDGKEALDFFRNYNKNQEKHPEEFPPLIVFLDINMPLVDGFEFLKEFSSLRTKFDLNASIIVLFTSSEREEDKKSVFSYEFVKGYMIKGQFSSEELKTEIEKHLRID